ncbi:MAG: HlyD family type I secretion periplasmic adaptor subunit, partial [Thermodesulfovibrionales bacterium]
GALESETASLKASIELTTEEVGMLKQLFAEGYASRRQLLQPEVRLAELQGRLGRSTADIARARQKIAEIQAEFDKLRNEWRNNVLEQLQKSGDDLTAVEEKIRVARERLARQKILAPQDGIVNGLKYTTVGGVIPPGGVVLDIVPTAESLLVEALISPDDIDVVRPGLMSHVRLTAYKRRTHSTLRGKVIYVSADSFRDPNTGAIFYKAHIGINPREELEGVGPVEIKPGMIAELEIVTGKRTMIRYLFDPIIDSLNRAFKEA